MSRRRLVQSLMGHMHTTSVVSTCLKCMAISKMDPNYILFFKSDTAYKLSEESSS